MRARYVAAIIVFVLITLSPLAVKLATGELRFGGGAQVGSTGGVSSTTAAVSTSSGALLVGCGESHRGADYLIVCPAKAYVISPGSVVRVNVTVKFAHPQPCPHSSWRIEVSDLNNVKVVGETSTKLVNAYTAVKTYDVKVLGNGSLTVTYYYGVGCPYGTEEVVKVLFFVVKSLPESSAQPSTSEQQAQAATTVATQPSINVTGVLTEVSTSGKYVIVDNHKIYIKGAWTCGNEEVRWRDLLNSLSADVGQVISVNAVSENGELLAVKIVAGSTTCVRGGEGG